MTPTAVVGAFLSLVMAGVSYRIWGAQGAFAAGLFGALATLIQLISLNLVQSAKQAPIQKFIVRWGAGMVLRFVGIVAIAVAVGVDRAHFPPLPTALGFLGVLIPLLFFEVRLIR